VAEDGVGVGVLRSVVEDVVSSIVAMVTYYCCWDNNHRGFEF